MFKFMLMLLTLTISVSTFAQELPVLPGSMQPAQLELMPLAGPMHMQYPPSKLLDHIFIMSELADTLSTIQAKVALDVQSREQFVWMNNGWRFTAVKLTVSTLVVMYAHHLRSQGHRRLANTLQIGGIVLNGSAVVLNERTIAKFSKP